MNTRSGSRARQDGIVLISSLLLLLVITILALAMFRSMGLSERIAGNVREKQRALHAAVVAQQYAEWLISSGNVPSTVVTCSATGNVNNTSYNAAHVCQNGINPNPLVPTQFNPQTLPWTDGNGHNLGFTYTLPNTTPLPVTGTGANVYAYAPAFYIQYMGVSADGSNGYVYKIDAVGYGGSPLSVAVVESLYEISSSVQCPSCNP